jgi:hypothetical protein
VQRPSREPIQRRADAEPQSIGEPLADEIHAPALIPACNRRKRYPNVGRAFGALFGSNLQPLFTVEAVDPLGAHLPALASEENGQPPIPVADSGGGKFKRILRSGCGSR